VYPGAPRANRAPTAGGRPWLREQVGHNAVRRPARGLRRPWPVSAGHPQRRICAGRRGADATRERAPLRCMLLRMSLPPGSEPAACVRNQVYWLGWAAFSKTRGTARVDLMRPTCGTPLFLISHRSSSLGSCEGQRAPSVCISANAGCLIVLWSCETLVTVSGAVRAFACIVQPCLPSSGGP